MVVRAHYRNARISARKVRPIVDMIRGMAIEPALEKLLYSKKLGAAMVRKTLESAIANAENNYGLDIDELVVALTYVDEGPTMKRWRARAKGRSMRILKRSCHITVGVREQHSEESV